MPVTRLLPPEFSHKAAVWACKNKLLGQSRADDGILVNQQEFNVSKSD